MDPQEEQVRLLAILVRLHFETQSEAILELHRAKFSNVRIADLLGTTANTVNVAVARSKTKKQNE